MDLARMSLQLITQIDDEEPQRSNSGALQDDWLFFGHTIPTAERSKYTPKGLRSTPVSMAVAIQAPARAAARAKGTAAFKVGLSKKPPFQWHHRALAAVGRKKRRLMPWAVRCSTPRNRVITSRRRVPPPTPQAEISPAPRPQRKGRR